MDNRRRLTRSRKDRMLAGVAGGIGEYYDIDPTLIRLIFVIVAFATDGMMILIYILMAVIIPEEETSRVPQAMNEGVENGLQDEGGYIESETPSEPAPLKERADSAVLVGIGLVLLGLLLLVDRLGLFWWLDRDIIWPLLIVLLGIWVILRRNR